MPSACAFGKIFGRTKVQNGSLDEPLSVYVYSGGRRRAAAANSSASLASQGMRCVRQQVNENLAYKKAASTISSKTNEAGTRPRD